MLLCGCHGYFIVAMQAALEVRDVKIADDLISNILQISYQGLSSRLKKVGHMT